jgi:preprotein translocase subunit SecF
MLSTTANKANYKVDFLKYRWIWLAVSIAYLVIGVGAYILKGGFRYNIDFTGGAELRVSFEKETDISQVRDAMISNGWHEASIQTVGNGNQEFLIRVGSLESDTEAKIKHALNKSLGNKVNIDNIQWVGAEAGKDTTRNAVLAVMLSLLMLLVYIALRFEFRFGVGAVICLLHDVLAILTFLVLTGEPISLHILASLLAVIGYSLNDVIVVFARIRENFTKFRGTSEYDIANISINQTLSRTILTSFATTLSVVAILIWGGETLRGLALVMLVGIIVGTYSSIYIASPAMLASGRAKKA